jgi:hypothetical protein
MIGGHQSMATGVGERAEQPEGLYQMGVGRDTVNGRKGQDDHHGCGRKK